MGSSFTYDPLWWGPRNHPENIPFNKVLAEVVHGQEKVIDVGCGTNKTHPRLLGVDAYSEAADVRAFMWDMPFPDESVDGLVCFHALEHISKYRVLPTLVEFQRILKPGAKFIVVVPDLIWVLQRFIENPNVDWEMDMIFGSQDTQGNFHKTGFTIDILRKYWSVIPNCEIKQIYTPHGYRQQNLAVYSQKMER